MTPRLRLTRDGVQYLDAGGQVLPAQTLTTGPSVVSGMNSANPFGTNNNPGPFGNTVANTLTNTVGGMVQGVGNLAQGVGSAFTAQNGYQAGLAPTALTDYGSLISGAGTNALAANSAFNNNLVRENALANALVGQVNGGGPNPALLQLHNQTGNNINAQAALIAGQRGASANPGLVARQIANSGAGIEQNAVGQEAALEANQQLAAEGALGNLYGTVGNQITGNQTANTGLFTGATGAQNAQNSNQVSNYGMAQGINAKTAQSNSDAVNKTTGGLLNSAGSLLSFLAEGGEVQNPKLAMVAPKDRYPHNLMPSHLKDMATLFHSEKMAKGGIAKQTPYVASGGKVPGKAKVAGNSYQNDVVSAKLSPGEIVIPRSVLQSEDPVGNAAKFVSQILEKHGGGDEEDEFKSALKKAISGRKAK